jgi:hypothetical protein
LRNVPPQEKRTLRDYRSIAGPKGHGCSMPDGTAEAVP